MKWLQVRPDAAHVLQDSRQKVTSVRFAQQTHTPVISLLQRASNAGVLLSQSRAPPNARVAHGASILTVVSLVRRAVTTWIFSSASAHVVVDTVARRQVVVKNAKLEPTLIRIRAEGVETQLFQPLALPTARAAEQENSQTRHKPCA